jgi:hypothetical protein
MTRLHRSGKGLLTVTPLSAVARVRVASGLSRQIGTLTSPRSAAVRGWLSALGSSGAAVIGNSRP